MLYNISISNGTKLVDTSSPPDVSVIVNCVINIPLMFVSITGNALVLAAIFTASSLRRSPSIVFLSGLAVSDLLVGFVVQPLFIISGLAQDDFLGKLWLKVGFVCCGVSLCTITAISLDRFLALHNHIKYAVFMTVSRVRAILIIIWMYSIILPFIYTWSPNIYYQIVAVALCVYLSISTFSYIRIYRVVRHHQTRIYAQQQAVLPNQEIGDSLRIMRLKKSAISTFVFYIFMILCYTPVFIEMSMLLAQGQENTRSFGTTAVFLNSAINPILYSWRLAELRAAVIKTLQKLCCKSH
ncbi:histamine H2 receptor-like [Oculina patagonica]